MHRRDLLKLSAGAGAAWLAPSLLTGLYANPPPTPGTSKGFSWDRSLVLIEQRGGNDSLNCVVPYEDAAYYQARPTLAIPKDKVLPLSKTLGLNPAMGKLMDGIKAGDIAILLALGYDGPNYSHFRGIDIWNSGSSSYEVEPSGWLARILSDVSPTAPEDVIADSVIFGSSSAAAYGGQGPLAGRQIRLMTMNSPREIIDRAAKAREPSKADTDNPTLNRILVTQRNFKKIAAKLQEIESKGAAMKTQFPKGGLARQLQMIAKLLGAGAKVPVFKLTQGGYDTHSNQARGHERLITELANAMGAFREAMIEVGAWDRVAVATYSEFGRRIYENGSLGTDHGVAAHHFVMGGAVNGGFYGKQSPLGGNDLGHATDYRSMYLTLAQDFWNYQKPFLSDKRAKSLGFIKKS